MRIIINGCNGKMGQVVSALAQSEGITVAAGVDIRVDLKQNSYPVYPDLYSCHDKVDAIIDFSVPSGLPALLSYAQSEKIPLVLATTGFTPEDIHRIENASKTIPIFRSANFSLGVNLLIALCKNAAAFLGNNYDIEIIEKHHNQKVDAPSGTALMLFDAINETFSEPKRSQHGRRGDCKRTFGEIGIHAVRGGTIVGEHEVCFAGHDEVITLSHSAQSKEIFAQGALRAAAFIAGQIPGLYNMSHLFKF